MKARDIMTAPVQTVPPDRTVADIASLMIERRISAVPVVDSKGSVLGVISQSDLIRRPELGTDQARSGWLEIFLSDDARAQDFVKTHGLHARDVMSTPAISVSPDASLGDIVRLLERRRIKRVLVIERGALVGIVSRTDLLRALHVRGGLPATPTAADDATLRDTIQKLLAREDWANSAVINVQVADGVVHLWGAVESESQRRAVHVAVEAVAGVRSIEDHLVRALPG
ncbi:MAG TPA: CBS domain-containing protein [Burkholderiales bacterium]